MNILITGGASGLGEAITKNLAKDRSNSVYITYANSKEKAEKIQANFDNVSIIKCDFKKSEDIESLMNEIAEMDLDVLVNNAYTGTAIKTHFHKIAENEFHQDFMNNVIPTVRITQAAIKAFRKKKSGKIITVLTSYLVNTPPIGASCYIANKAYLHAMVKSWSSENVKFNISSNSVSPSFMRTQLSTDVDERVIEQMENSHPLKKLLTIDEVAETVDFLTKASTQLSGVDMLINAGVNIK